MNRSRFSRFSRFSEKEHRLDVPPGPSGADSDRPTAEAHALAELLVKHGVLKPGPDERPVGPRGGHPRGPVYDVNRVQLTIDGREELIEPTAPRHMPLTAAQYEILSLLAEHEVIRSIEAGRIVHAHRTPPCERCRHGRCGFTGTDGSEALRRLQARGLVRKLAAGLWTATP